MSEEQVETADNPVEEPEVETQEIEEVQELDDDGNPIPKVEEPEDEEVEFEDLKLKVPKTEAQRVKDALLRQADYTRKTQELAEERKTIAAERETIQQASQAEIDALALTRAAESQLASYQGFNWDAHFEQNPLDAPRDWAAYQGLINQRAQSAQQYAHLKGQRESQQQQAIAKRVEEGRAVLARDIPEWSPQHAETLLKHGVDRYGFTRAEIESFEDPRMVKVLHDAWKANQTQEKDKKAQANANKQQVAPAATVNARTAPPAGVHDKLPIDEWMKREAARVARKRA